MKKKRIPTLALQHYLLSFTKVSGLGNKMNFPLSPHTTHTRLFQMLKNAFQSIHKM